MTTTNPLAIDLRAAASGLAHSYLRLQEAQRPIDRKVANAEFSGMCKAISNLGFAMTETAVHLDVLDAHRAMVHSDATGGDRPSFRAAGNRAQQVWDAAFTDLVAFKVFGTLA